MPWSKDFQRGYARGYAKARSTASSRISKISKIARSWQDKSINGFNAKCASCQLWRRGQHDTKWGYCRQKWEHATDLGAVWSEANGRVVSEIVTQENFGCVNYIQHSQKFEKV